MAAFEFTQPSIPEAIEMLAAEGVRTAVVSMPCLELFQKQTAKYRREVLGGARGARVDLAVLRAGRPIIVQLTQEE